MTDLLLLRLPRIAMGAEEGGEQRRRRDGAGEDATLPTDKRPMSADQFLTWKRQKDAAISARKVELARKREEDISAGVVQMNGRELFLREPWVFDNSYY